MIRPPARARRRRPSRGPAHASVSGGICIASPGRGSTWMTASDPTLFRNWPTGQHLKDGYRVSDPTLREIRNHPRKQMAQMVAMALLLAIVTARVLKAGASFVKSSTWNERWG